jgi:BirA family biotin operon repressor/biotin-[acetyl-CoA-carboxylase] ligase
VDSSPWRIERFEEIDSTNRYLAECAKSGAQPRMVAVADFQSAGRGRRDRSWDAPPKSSFLASVLVAPAIDLSDAHLVTVACSLAMCDALNDTFSVPVALKWPNDLLLGDHKVAGVLAEAVSTPSSTGFVVGVGVNLRPVGDNEHATSLLDATGVDVDRDALLDAWLARLDLRLEQIETPEGRALVQRDYAASLATLGQLVRVERTNDTLTGRALSVDDRGQLVVETDNGLVTCNVGDVIHLRKQPS